MGGEFAETTLGSLLSFANGRSSPERGDGLLYPVYGSNGVIGRAAEANSDAGSIVIGRVGTYCGSLYLSNERCWVTDNAIRATALEGNDSRFLFYLLGTLRLNDWRAGSGQPLLNQDILSRIPAAVPEPDEQRAIVHILGTLDDKIELNRRMNETLEAMARALFKSWFVDFDPVRAKAEGRDPCLPQHLADLFPDSFENSELGEIPRGWKVASIYEIADVIYGAPFASAKFNTEGLGLPLIRIRDLANESPAVWTTEAHPKGYVVRPGEIVVGMDGEFRAYLWGGAEGWLNQRVCVFVPKGGASAAFVRNSILEPLAHIESTETATTVIHLGKGDIDRFVTVIPTDDVLAIFSSNCQPWYSRIIAAKREARSLAALRDALLPKLVSGELRVRDAEKFIGRAA